MARSEPSNCVDIHVLEICAAKFLTSWWPGIALRLVLPRRIRFTVRFSETLANFFLKEVEALEQRTNVSAMCAIAHVWLESLVSKRVWTFIRATNGWRTKIRQSLAIMVTTSFKISINCVVLFWFAGFDTTGRTPRFFFSSQNWKYSEKSCSVTLLA